MRTAFAVVFVALLAGCGGGDSGSAPELSAAAVHEAPSRVRAEGGTFAFEATYVREVPDDPDETYLTLTGAVDLRAGSGRMEADLSMIFDGLGSSEPFGEPIELSWTLTELTAVVDGEERSTPRASAQEDGGLIGRLPDEPAALLDLLDGAEEIRPVGEERVDGRPTTRFACFVDSRRAGARGVPAELAPAFAQALHGSRLPLEVWLDGDGLPRRIEYLIRMKPVASGGKQVLPARAIRARYDLSDFGAEVDAE